MKKIILGLCTILMVACSEEEIPQTPAVNSLDGVSTVVIGEGTNEGLARNASCKGQLALRFQDEAALEKFKLKLSEMSSEERRQAVDKYGITTLHDLAEQADKELDAIGSRAASDGEFRALYAEYKQKYEGYLLTNPTDSTDLTLYVPDGDNVESYIGNTNGLYMVGDKVENTNLKQEVAKSVLRMANVSTTSEAPVNTSVYSPKKHKRVYFSAHMEGIYLWVAMSCKKKMWYGWKNDSDRAYYFEPYLSSNVAYVDVGKYGQDVETERLPRYVCNKNVGNGFSFILGKLKGSFPITGKFYTWTDMTSEHDAKGNEITEKLNGQVVPKCIKAKAHVVAINLTDVH